MELEFQSVQMKKILMMKMKKKTTDKFLQLQNKFMSI